MTRDHTCTCPPAAGRETKIRTCPHCYFVICLDCGRDAGFAAGNTRCTRGCDRYDHRPPEQRPRATGPWKRRHRRKPHRHTGVK